MPGVAQKHVVEKHFMRLWLQVEAVHTLVPGLSIGTSQRLICCLALRSVRTRQDSSGLASQQVSYLMGLTCSPTRLGTWAADWSPEPGS